MSYHKIIEYKILPTDTFKIIRGCAGCGCKQTFSCKEHFRVNANGNRLDVWLIYGCDKCGHTYNLPVYERINPAKISEQEYHKYLSNDKQKVLEIGTNKAIFIKNKAEIAWDLSVYEVVPCLESAFDIGKDGILIMLHNPYDLPVRADKVVADIFQISRSETKRLLCNGQVSVSIVRNGRTDILVG